MNGFPMFRPLPESSLVNGPIVQDRRLEVSAVGPNQRVDFRVDLYLVEKREFAEGTIQLACDQLNSSLWCNARTRTALQMPPTVGPANR